MDTKLVSLMVCVMPPHLNHWNQSALCGPAWNARSLNNLEEDQRPGQPLSSFHLDPRAGPVTNSGEFVAKPNNTYSHIGGHSITYAPRARLDGSSEVLDYEEYHSSAKSDLTMTQIDLGRAATLQPQSLTALRKHPEVSTGLAPAPVP